jgi:hypothetical protein
MANVIFKDLCHETVDAAAHIGEQHQNVGAVVAGCERALDGVDSAASAPNASDERPFFLVKFDSFFHEVFRPVACVKRRSEVIVAFASYLQPYAGAQDTAWSWGKEESRPDC